MKQANVFVVAISAKFTTFEPRRRGIYRNENKENAKMGAWLQIRDLCEIYDSPPLSNSAEFELISKPGGSCSKLFNFGFVEYRETCRNGFD